MNQACVKKVLSDTSLQGQIITIQGWVRTRRDSKAGFSFLAVYDGSCFEPIQVIIAKDIENYHSEVLKLTAGCAVAITGQLVASPSAGQSQELQATEVKVIGWVEDPETYPISPKRHSVEYLREVAHLRPRTNLIGAVTRLRNTTAFAIHRFFHEKGFYWISTPLITASDCEGAGELFRVSTLDLCHLPKTAEGKIDFAKDFFGKETFLTVSGQLNVEAYCLAVSKVYTFGPTFRAENSNTARHLAEFWMVEPEIAFADLEEDARLAEQLLKFVCEIVLSERQDDLSFFNQRIDDQCIKRIQSIIQHTFEHMDYSEAINYLQRANKPFEYPVTWGLDLKTEHERYLAEELVGRPVVVKNYPKEIKAFYMRLNPDGKTVAAMDVLAPGIGEIIGGSQREERLDVFDNRLNEHKINKDQLAWYRDLRRYGSVPHAGFGLGFERLISYLTGISNVRDVIPFPRTPMNAEF